MPDARQSAKFGILFALGILLLTAPWPGIGPAFGAAFRRETALLLGIALKPWVVSVAPVADARRPAADLDIAFGDPRRANPDGTVPVKGLILNGRSLGWMPVAMALALALATPVRWAVRWKLVLGSVALAHLLTLTSLAVLVASVLLDPGDPSWLRQLCDWIQRATVESLWMSFVGPFLAWLGLLLATEWARDTGRVRQRDRG